MSHLIRIRREPNVYTDSGMIFSKCNPRDEDKGLKTFKFRMKTIRDRRTMLRTSFMVMGVVNGRKFGKLKFSLKRDNEVLSSCLTENTYYLDIDQGPVSQGGM